MNKMNKIILSISIIFSVVFCNALWAQEKTDDNAATEEVQITNGYKIIVPKGAKIERVGSQIKVQDPVSYLLKEFVSLKKCLDDEESHAAALDKRLNSIEDNQHHLQTMLENIQQTMGLNADMQIAPHKAREAEK